MKILIISYIYAPDQSPRAYRWAAIAAHWAAQGHDVHVVTAWRRGDRRHEIMDGVSVHRTGAGLLDLIRGWLGRNAHRGESETAPAISARTRAARTALSGISRFVYDRTWKRLYWPDYACTWVFSAFRKASSLCRVGCFDALITVAPPFTANLVGLWLKRNFSSLRWIADIGDPFSLTKEIPPNNLRLYEALNRRSESKVLGDADAVTVTVEGCRRAYKNFFPAVGKKISVIPPLLSLPPAVDGKVFAQRDGDIHLVFVGTLYRDIRNPAGLMALFRQLALRASHVHLHFFGDMHDCANIVQPSPNVHVHGLVPRPVVARAMQTADVLVNIGNRTAHQLPSKIVEYMASGKAILNVTSRHDDTAAELLAAYPAALSIRVDQDPTPGQVDQVLSFLTRKWSVEPVELDRLISAYAVRPIADRYAALLACLDGTTAGTH